MKHNNNQKEEVKDMFTPGSEMEEDYLRWFAQRKITLTGVHAGRYLDEEDFATYGKWAVRQIDQAKKENEELKAKLKRMEQVKNIGMELALEFGYKQCEKGENIQAAIQNYHNLK